MLELADACADPEASGRNQVDGLLHRTANPHSLTPPHRQQEPSAVLAETIVKPNCVTGMSAGLFELGSGLIDIWATLIQLIRAMAVVTTMTGPEHRPNRGARRRIRGVCGELLLIARLKNLSTHKKRQKAYAKPEADGLTGRGAKSPRSAEPRPRRGHARASAG